MGVSARVLGEKFRLTAQEMNRVLVRFGILQGTPGNYELTELGKKYAIVKDHHRGCGGYSYYNRDWSTITYDESIKKILNVTDEVRKKAIEEVRQHRAKQYAERAIQAAKYEAEQLAKEKEIIQAQIRKSKNLKTAGIIALVGIGVITTGVIVYKIRKSRKKQNDEKKKNEELSRED